MAKQLSGIQISVPDLATIRQGTAADAFRNSLSLAQHTEQPGYKRY